LAGDYEWNETDRANLTVYLSQKITPKSKIHSARSTTSTNTSSKMMTSIMLGGTKQANDDDDEDLGSIWSNAVKWINSNGGFVHSSLRYNESQRQVYLDTSPSSCGGAIDAGTTLLRIPDACLPSLHSVERDEEFGQSLFGVVHSLEASLYHDAQDVVVALFLARQQQQQQQSPSFYEPYIATLPVSSNTSLTNDGVNSSVCNNNIKLLPRQWDSETLKRRLYGTSLYKQIIKEQNGIKCEYELIKTAWMRQQKEQQQSSPTTKDDQKQTSQSSLFPTCEQYDNMMSLVTSRGFDGLGYDGVDVMIPLLDLLNHVRGQGVDNTANGDGSGGVAHVRYERYHEEDNETDEDGSGDGEPTTKRIKTDIDDSTTATKNIRSNNSGGGERGGVKVTAGQSIVANGTKLQMTYGAKSNSTLLGRYGFCIADNVEPDGECLLCVACMRVYMVQSCSSCFTH